MDNNNSKDNNSPFENSNQKNLSNFNSYLNYKNDDNSTPSKNSESSKKSINKATKIKLINKTIFIDNFQSENESSSGQEEEDIGFNDLTSIPNQNDESSCEFDSINNYEYNLLTYIEKLNYLIKNYNKQFIKNIKKPIIKCLLGEIQGNDNKECNHIPLITRKKYSISFFCDNHNNKKNIDIEAYSLIKNMDKIFIKSPRFLKNEDNNNKENINNNINLLKNISKFELNITNLKKKIQFIKTNKRKKLKEKISNFNNFLSDYNNKNKYDESFIIQSLKRIRNIYISFTKDLNSLIYLIIINRLLYEYEHESCNNLNVKNKIILLINLKNSLELIERNKYKISNESTRKQTKKKKYKKNKHKSFKFNWIIEFYFENEIKSNIDKNVFIAISELGFIYIILVNFKTTYEINIEEKTNVYELIMSEKFENFRPNKITKLKHLFKTKTTDNYFIINSMKDKEFGKAIIINVVENNNYIDIKGKYKIEIVQIIKDVNGLYSSLEFFYKDKNYLLNFYSHFYLWSYNQEINQIEKNIIENGIFNDNNNFNYGPLIYEENKKLFIIQCFKPKSIIEFYKLIEEKENFNFDKIDKIIEFKEEESTLKINNNYFIYNSKFLLLSSGRMNNNTTGGIYIINLEKFEKISFYKFYKCAAINSIIPSKTNNIILVSSIYLYKQYLKNLKDKSNEKSNKIIYNNVNRGRMLTIKIIEVNSKISFKIQNFTEGPFYFINCKNLFLDEYFFTCVHKNNNLIKLKDDGKCIHYFKINI